MSARRVLAQTALSLLLLSSGAQAAAPQRPTVAQAGQTTLRAYDDRGGELCIELVHPDGGGMSCVSSPDSGTVATASIGGETRAVGVVTPPDVARVELWRKGQVLGSAPTDAGAAYTGKAAGRVRFAVLSARGLGPGTRVRLLDGEGALTGALDAGLGDPVLSHRRLLHGRTHGVRWSVDAFATSTLAPTVIDPAAEMTSRCVTAAIGSDADSETCLTSGLGTALDALLAGPPNAAAVEDRCRSAFRLVHGTAGLDVTSAEVLLGSGARRAARLVRVPGQRVSVFAAVVPRSEAVRAVLLARRSGTVAARVGAAPLTVACAAGGTGPLYGPSSTWLLGEDSLKSLLTRPLDESTIGPISTVEVADGEALRVADGADGGLCLALPGKPFTVFGCRPVSPSLAEPGGTVDDFEHPHVIAVALPARVATIEAKVTGGRTLPTPTVAGEAYTGPYAGRVRFALVRVPADETIKGLRYLDAGGNVLYSEDDVDAAPAPTPRRPVRIAGRAGGPSLYGESLGSGSAGISCFTLTAGGPAPRAGLGCLGFGRPSVLVRADCASRRLTVAVAAAFTDAARVVAVTGRTRRPVPLNAHHAGVVVLPAASGLDSVRLERRGAPTRVVRFAAPSAAEQCGWSATGVVASRASRGA